MYYCILTFYVIWVVCTLVNQFIDDPDNKNNKAFLLLMKNVPKWNFFAPNPGVSDMNLLRRFKLENGEISAFEEIAFRANRVNSFALVFNPRRRLSKALIDHASLINSVIKINELDKGDLEKIKLCFSYLSLLNYCSKLPTNHKAEFVQLIVIETYGYTEINPPRLVLNSDFHKI